MTWLADLQLGTVVLHTKHGGPSFRGIVEAVYDDGVLLSSVVNLDEEAMVIEAGSSFFLREQLYRVQLLDGVV